jgi:hypothetical protein
MTVLNQGNDIGINYYNRVKAHYESVKPIRGARAAQNIRPMYRRERTHECVVAQHRADGEWFGYRLYDTNLVMVSPTGIMEFKHDGWNSTSSSQFINEIGVRFFDRTFVSYKRNNKIWVADRYSYSDATMNGVSKYPIQSGAIQFKFAGGDTMAFRIVPMSAIEEVKPIIDRKKMKEAMAVYMPMINYMATVLKMTGGLLTYEMRDGLMDRYDSLNSWRRTPIYKCTTGDEFTEIQYSRSGLDGDIEKFANVAEHGTPDDWMKVLCVVAQSFDHVTEKVGQVEYEVSWGDSDATKRMTTQYLANITLLVKPTAIRDKFARAVKNSRQDVWTSKVVNHGLQNV